ncbi:ead/Ea22-like family protein [Citrobacter braakii]|uniref:ead/Ea22-like family protein n=1 Tax=Citrobacter braakii TaxID=57706 RepID=UPI001C7D057C|nr:ead/Ea22-like family protein [Citrobacter braakii]
MTALNKQALREAAGKATPGKWRRASTIFNGITRGKFSLTKEEILAHASEKRDAEFIAAANPATVLALLDELEAKDKSIGFLKDQLAQLANFNPDWDRLEAATDSLREHMAKLSAAEKRIAELDARTVTLPPKEHDNGTDSQIDINAGFANRMWQKCYDAIRAAGIGVKGE